ncbi:integral membrane sensor signal transduction histidine kinase [Gluconacetobacter diazotrophicus PA1 5]|uniref:Two-component sensor histidine kinase n=2 Tax=Gluconacetobacter diazotrophicus TaxID=33996 RepID=A0A7W4FCL8_GLUDI|nr:histidine kinase [Gluconacetobacter diazotrophicus]ACI51667.1 integral membrane sensor signal transduction histidine kinase [Gluconacetobacter diazotrophicus PA1 5]MBB2155301.1 two-component sensor histidine kinase [Gluconacetobacter diazotrophicus]TWB11011.1 two-component system sensor histidine kinase DesK [Gluconacetobacter diazotrophicus]CAP55137.1 putative two-component system sensor protein [Gluconacetobacter diazotrophicus PA1 5]
MTPAPATRNDPTMHTRGERWWEGPWPWLVYLIFYVLPWAWEPPHATDLIASAIGLAVFLPVYFVSHRLTDLPLLACAGIMLGIGIALAPFGSWTVFPIYASAVAGHLRPVRFAVATVAAIAVATALAGLAWHQPVLWWFPGILLVIIIGGSTMSRVAFHERTQALLASQEEVRRLAGTAERERIARDLHDVIGRALTLTALKADLAARLAPRDAEAAEAEMRAVAALAREGLAEIRAALAGHAGGSLAHEIAASTAALEAANIASTLAGDPAAIPADAGAVLAMTLREAVTNVIRHAEATCCVIQLDHHDGTARLSVCDNGHGRSFTEGRGLTGMRQRLAAAGGALAFQPGTPEAGRQGIRLVATVPA